MSDRPSGGKNSKGRPGDRRPGGSGRPGGGSRPGGGRPGSGRPGGKPGGKPGTGRGRDTGRPSDRREPNAKGQSQRPGRSAKKEITAGTGQLPRWIRDEILHSTPKERRDAAIGELEAGLTALADERFGKSAGSLRRAKELAPRAAKVR